MPDRPDPDLPGRCPHCDAPLLPPGRFCAECGRAVDAPEAEPATVRTDPDVQPRFPPPASGRGPTRACVSCGTLNPRTRELCVSCGLDLDPEDRTAVPAREDRPAAVTRTGWAGWWRPVAAVLAAVALVVVTVLAVAGLGPFAGPAPDDPPLEAVAFPTARYPDPVVLLELSQVGALTSAAPEGDRVFAPDRMVDGLDDTAWRADPAARPVDAPETIDLDLSAPGWVHALLLANGDQFDEEAYRAAGRVSRMTIRFDGGGSVSARLVDRGLGWQVVRLEEPVLTTGVRLELLEVEPGTRHPGAALSGLRLEGHRADEVDAALARERAEQRPATGVAVAGIEAGAEGPGRLFGRDG